MKKFILSGFTLFELCLALFLMGILWICGHKIINFQNLQSEPSYLWRDFLRLNSLFVEAESVDWKDDCMYLKCSSSEKLIAIKTSRYRTHLYPYEVCFYHPQIYFFVGYYWSLAGQCWKILNPDKKYRNRFIKLEFWDRDQHILDQFIFSLGYPSTSLLSREVQQK